ncbi:putative receptor-like protein kinase At5g39000 [Euphorbia lathyris]|uniref:putative receptor-like protein kinase At5g39000 n=1 Tax=Euphorbia lathyris TaxID=212925 RepID=UPI0033134E8E
MLASAVFLYSLLNLLLGTSAVNCPSPPPNEIILLNCGTSSSSAAKSADDRTWYGDSNSKFSSSNLEASSESKATTQDSTLNSLVPYMTARISPSNFTYSFPISPGPKFIRLYFYPALYTYTSTDFNTSNSFFTVTANNYTLLKNFSASLNLQERVAYVIKEFIVTLQENQTLNVTFSPSPSSLAFINGIEIVPIPENLYIKDKDYPNYKYINSQTPFYFDSFIALETISRLNVGGGSETDPQMFRSWADDTPYIYGGLGVLPHIPLETVIKYTQATPCYTAPPVVYKTARSMGPNPNVNLMYNLTWQFSVDSGFNYLVRLHFCETTGNSVNATVQRVFLIFINNMTASEGFDVFFEAGGSDIPVYQDYIVKVPEENQRKKELLIALHPKSDVSYADAILNGLEIFKLNKSDGDLSGLNPVLPSTPEQRLAPKKRTESKTIPIIGSVLGVVFALCLLIFFFVYLAKAKAKEKDHNKSNRLPFSYTSSSAATPAVLLPTDLCRQFTLPEIRTATRNFHDENVIGSGGFGTVYKGFVENGSVPVAIKRLDSSSKQGIKEFHTEIEMLSRLRHANLVCLIGYCAEEDEMILVYEFMDQGNLQDHIYKANKVAFSWKQRLQICIGAARGLHYLHTGAKHAIIHRDVKSSNILLDSNWMAKVSDFGLSKIGPTTESQTHVTTVVRGSFGYLDPEYYRRQHLTEKSDVYSFGVVLLEVIYSRPPIVSTEPKEQVNLVEWARKCSKKGTIAQNIDPKLKGDIATVSLNKFMEIAESCVREKATERPTISDVVWGLEFALELQETAEKNVDACDDNIGGERQKNYGDDHHDPLTSSSAATLLGSSEANFSNSDSDPARPENVFSEIMNQQDGR